jgi:acylphosphatase
MADWMRKQIRVVGHVQGVGFRYFTKQQANHYGIVGSVRNLPNGDVEIDAAGPIEDLRLFVEGLQKGPSGARVQEIFEQVLPLQNLSEVFYIQHF